MSLAELHLWSLRAGWGKQKWDRLEHLLDNFAVHYCDAGLCPAWAEVRDQCFRDGTPIDLADARIAATSLYLGFPLVTHNRGYFEKVANLQVLSPS
jgi:predicted nucleic acid-binding protein